MKTVSTGGSNQKPPAPFAPSGLRGFALYGLAMTNCCESILRLIEEDEERSMRQPEGSARPNR